MSCAKEQVMISYQWDIQKQALEIAHALKQLGFEIWIDLENMSGDIYDKMAEAVESSSIVLVCMTSKYEKSANCARELKYAVEKKKKLIPLHLEKDYKAGSSLGLLMAGKLYFDFTDRNKFKENIEHLKAEIGQQLRKQYVKDEVEKVKDEVAKLEVDVKGLKDKHHSPTESTATTVNILPNNMVVIGDNTTVYIQNEDQSKGGTGEPEQCKPHVDHGTSGVYNKDRVSYSDVRETFKVVPVCFGHNSNGAVRVTKGEDATTIKCSRSYILYVSTSPAEGFFPFSVGHAGTGEEWRHCIVEGLNAGERGWTHDFTFYAYNSKMPDTVPFTVCHAMHSDEWKYRLSYERDFAGNKEWINDFMFYAFPFDPDNILPVSVGSNSMHMTTRVVEGVSAKTHQFEHIFTFKALQSSRADAVCYSVGVTGTGEHERHKVVKGLSGSCNDWKHEMNFYAFEEEKPGTIPIAVCHAKHSEGLKYRVLKNCTSAGDKDWIHDLVFYAYPADTSHLMTVSVGFESEHKCARVKMGEILQELYFKHNFMFYGFQTPYPGTIPISFGEAGADYNRTLRSRVVKGPCADGDGWKHVFKIYAYADRKPGTIPIAVGHANFALGGGGWKYRIEQNCENAGTEGWCHDFCFYVFPHL